MNLPSEPHSPATSAPATDSPATSAPASAEDLFSALYDELRRMARREVRRVGARDQVGTHTLVHEAWLSLGGAEPRRFNSTGHFLAYATRAMRGLVIDRVRARHAKKRGGHQVITLLDTETAEQLAQPETLDAMSQALETLASADPLLAQVVDLKFFCGFTFAEIAAMQDSSERTVQRQWHKARMLLHRALSE